MPLQRQNVPAPFAVGPQDKVDPKQLDLKAVQLVENGRYIKEGKIQKKLGSTLVGAPPFSSPKCVTSLGDQLLVRDAAGLKSLGTGSYAPGSSLQPWLDKGWMPPLSVKRSDVRRGPGTVSKVAVAVNAALGLEIYVFDQQTAASNALVSPPITKTYIVRDTATGQILGSGTPPNTGGVTRVFAVTKGFLILDQNYAALVDYATLTVGVSVSLLGQAGGDACQLAAVPGQPDVVLVASITAGTPNFALAKVSVDATTGSITMGTPVTITPFALEELYGLGMFVNVDGSVVIGTTSYNMAGSPKYMRLRFTVVDPNTLGTSYLGTLVKADLYDPGYSAGLANVAVYGSVRGGVHDGVGYILWERDAEPGSPTYTINQDFGYSTWAVRLTSYASPGAAFKLAGGIRPVSAVCTVAGIGYFLGVNDPSPYLSANKPIAQGRTFLFDLAGNVLARVGNDGSAAIGAVATSLGVNLTGPCATGQLCAYGTVLHAAVGIQEDITIARLGLAVCDFDLSGDSLVRSARELGGSAFFAGGGMLWQYDSANVVEQGFSLYPTIKTVAFGNAYAGGQSTGKVYRYMAVYAWTDAAGAVHRSAPTEIVVASAVPAPTGPYTDSVAMVSVTSLWATRKTDVRIEIYRNTEADPDNYHFASETPNDPTKDYTACWGGGLDATIASNALIYTTGEQKAWPAPVPRALTVFKNRLCAIDAELPSRVWYSKQVFPGQAVEFSPFFYKDIDPSSDGPVTALGVLDDKLIFFKRDVSFFMTGDGPAPSGLDDDFSTPILINTNTGCVAPESVVTAGPGIVYQSAKGIFILDRSLRDQYIGASVENYTMDDAGVYEVSDAILMPGATEARFAVPSKSVVLTYNWVFNRWSVATGVTPVSIALWKNEQVLLTSTGKVLKETPGTFTDDGAHVPLKITRGWMSFAGLSGFQRVYKMIILGDYLSSHQLRVTIAVDYNEDPVQVVTLSPDDVNAPGLVGGLAMPLGGGGIPAYQYRIHMLRQKCQAIKVWIEELPPVADPGEGLSLSGLTFEVGALPGVARLPRAQSAG